MAVAWGAFSAGEAQAVVVTVGGQNWDVTTFTGTRDSNASKFAQPPAPGVMPWYSNQSLADEFVTAVGSSLGTIYFAYSSYPETYFSSELLQNVTREVVQLRQQSGAGLVYGYTSAVWAQATALPSASASVPAPLPVFGAAAAFGYSRKLRNRIKSSKGLGSTATAV
jgi:hypothetical protein